MFITFEGIEGCGKTTQVKRAAQYLQDSGRICVVTREPGGTKIGRKIRGILLDPENLMLDPVAELMLYTADRAQHVKEVIAPALAEGKTVLCDRFFDATVAYQGHGRGLDISLIRTLHKIANGGITPDLTLLLDLSPHTGLDRAWQRIGRDAGVGGESRFEEETLGFHERVRHGYLALAKGDPGRIRIVDAALSEERVFREIIRILSEALVNESDETR